MTRIAVIIASVLLAACDVGSVLQQNTTNPDGGGGGGSDGSSNAVCETLVSPAPPDHHNAGMGCMTNSGCHNPALAPGGPPYSYAGTVYKDAAGTQPYAGATILITMGGVTKKLIAGDQGNFQITPGLLAAPTTAMTATASASACPSKTPMAGALITAGGNCGAGGTCHGGTQGKIHIP